MRARHMARSASPTTTAITVATLGPAAFGLAGILVAVLLGPSLGSAGKFVRVNPPNGSDITTGISCWVNRARKSSPRYCCPAVDVERSNGLTCSAAGMMINAVLTSGVGSVVVPLSPWLLNVNTAVTQRRPHDMCRLAVHAAILMWRALVLYLAVDFVEAKLQGEQRTHCWYGAVRSRACTWRWTEARYGMGERFYSLISLNLFYVVRLDLPYLPVCACMNCRCGEVDSAMSISTHRITLCCSWRSWQLRA